MGRNTNILEEIAAVLSLTPEHLVHLEGHFDDRLILDAGNTTVIAAHAKVLRLRVEPHELGAVLDYIAAQGMVGINLDVVEEAINSLLGEDRFQEPEN